MLSGERTTCIFDFASRGASEAIPVPAKTLWYIATMDKEEKTWKKMDRAAVDAFQQIYLGGGPLPRYCFVWLPGVDHLSHFHGPEHEIVFDRTHDIDIQVGRMMETLYKAGIYDDTLVTLVADHGMRDNERHLDSARPAALRPRRVKDVEHRQFTSLYHNAARGSAQRFRCSTSPNGRPVAWNHDLRLGRPFE